MTNINCFNIGFAVFFKTKYDVLYSSAVLLKKQISVKRIYIGNISIENHFFYCKVNVAESLALYCKWGRL